VPLVSIITPVFNAAPWLLETLASVRAQTLTDWEQILVDDGSCDNSVAIAQAAAQQDPRFRLIRTPRNMGPSSARNLAVDVARGRFIAFLDADDLWLPEKLALSVAWITSRGYSFIYHDYRHMSHDGLRVGALIKAPEKLDWRALHTRRGTGCLTVVIDRKKIPVFSFPPIAPYRAEDFCLWAQIIRMGHIGHRLPADLACYRLSAGSRSANKLEGSINAWHLYREVSMLPIPVAAFWWLQYAWSALTLYLWARPRERRA
jgi:teichuronic acid biosynthesis glycosyltransferase TuaG